MLWWCKLKNGHWYLSGRLNLPISHPCFLLQMTSTSWGFSSSPLLLWLCSSVWLLPFVIPLNVDVSTKKVTMKTSEYEVQMWRREQAIPHIILSLILHDGFVFNIYLFRFFSYNWPAQNDGVNYRDADEVNTVCDLSYLLLTEEFCVDISSFLLLTGPFSPQVFVHHLTAATEAGTETKRQKLLRLICNNYAPDGKVWGVTWHIILWRTSVSN